MAVRINVLEETGRSACPVAAEWRMQDALLCLALLLSPCLELFGPRVLQQSHSAWIVADAAGRGVHCACVAHCGLTRDSSSLSGEC